MELPSIIAIYLLFWSLSVFLVLPFGVKTSEEAGVAHVAGQAESAPHEVRLGRIAWRVTIVATILFGLFYANYEYGWITPQMFDVLNMMG